MTTAWSSLLVLLLAGGVAASAHARGEQAAFSVAITLHSMNKPASVAQLCRGGRPTDMLGAAIHVQCPAPAESESAKNAPAARGVAPEKRPLTEVIVTF